MTAQMSEVLMYEGEERHMLELPLKHFFDLGGHDPGFQFTSTALWRGYVGRWEVLNDRLYLTHLSGRMKTGEKAHISHVFPGFEDRVFAHWYSGAIRIPEGKLIQYVHSGFSSTYERDVLLDFEDGVLLSKHVRHNGKAPKDAKEGYRIAAMTSVNFEDKKEGS